MSNGTNTASESSPPESQTDTLTERPSLLTCVSSWSPVQLANTEDLLMWLQADSRASHSAQQVNNSEPTTPVTCGPRRGTVFATYSQHPFCLRTCQDLFPAVISEPSLLIWPRWGMWGDGELSALPTPERLTSGIGYGSWPTPAARDHNPTNSIQHLSEGRHVDQLPNRVKMTELGMWATPTHRDWKGPTITEKYPDGFNKSLPNQIAKWPTPNASDHRDRGGPSTPAIQRRQAIGKQIELSMKVDGALNPNWVEWLMGWPVGWTDLKPSGTVRFLRWWHAHGGS